MKPKTSLVKNLCIVACLLVMVLAAQAQTQTTPSPTAKPSRAGLITQLSKGLSISPTQARGGAGALFGLAKSR